MKKLYTLRNAMSGNHGISLNGKVFCVKRDEGKHLHFLDIADNMKEIWRTTAVNSISYSADGIIITTRNTTYDLIDISFIIPTTTKVTVDEDLEDDIQVVGIPDLAVVDSKDLGCRHIHYGDGYYKQQIRLNRPTSEKEIREWLKSTGSAWKTKQDAAWYEDYATIEKVDDGTDTVWILTEWNRYTD